MSGDFSFLKGNINTIILCSLYDKDPKSGDKYGYEIAKEIKERTENKYEIKQPTLYSYLKKLEQQDLITSYWGTESNGGRRRYYSLTAKGRQDCERFMAEWEYHKAVLNTLVTSADTPLEVTQEEVTPLFGSRNKKPKTHVNLNTQEFREQDELSRQLDALIGGSESNEATTSPVEEFPQEDAFEPIEQVSEEPEQEQEVVEQPIEVYVEEPTIEEQPLATQERPLANFDVNQDNADDFMLQFEERARAISETLETKTENNENYQHVLMKVIGDQLDDMRDFDSEQEAGSQKYYTDHPVALEDVAENLARQGIRMRLYNHASSHFKSKTLMPVSNVICKATWLTYAVAAIFFGILLFASIAINNWMPFLITALVLLVLPVGATIYALYDPSRKEKPKFAFNRLIIATSILAVFVVLLALGLSILNQIELSDFAAVGSQILIPTGIAILPPVFVIAFNYFYKKY